MCFALIVLCFGVFVCAFCVFLVFSLGHDVRHCLVFIVEWLVAELRAQNEK